MKNHIGKHRFDLVVSCPQVMRAVDGHCRDNDLVAVAGLVEKTNLEFTRSIPRPRIPSPPKPRP